MSLTLRVQPVERHSDVGETPAPGCRAGWLPPLGVGRLPSSLGRGPEAGSLLRKWCSPSSSPVSGKLE